jgi:hypothetical protein
MNYSSSYVMWVVGIEVQSRFPVHFCGQLWTPLHNQNIQEWNINRDISLVQGLISVGFYNLMFS